MKQYRLLLNGKWQDSDDHLAVVNPATGNVFAEIAMVDRVAVRQAFKDAEAAFSNYRIKL